MGFRIGFLSGFSAGYYLGARAGRPRYEQINRTVAKARRSPVVETAAEKARTLVDRDGDRDGDGAAPLPVVAPQMTPDVVVTDVAVVATDVVTLGPDDYSSSR